MTSSNPSHLLKAPSPNTDTLGVEASTHECWGDTNIQSLSPSLGSHFLTSQMEVAMPTQDVSQDSKTDRILWGVQKGSADYKAHTCTEYDFYFKFAVS